MQENELLRSAYQIAHRKGKATNWEAFENNLRKELLHHHGAVQYEEADEQDVMKATCTAKTFELPEEECEASQKGWHEGYRDGLGHKHAANAEIEILVGLLQEINRTQVLEGKAYSAAANNDPELAHAWMDMHARVVAICGAHPQGIQRGDVKMVEVIDRARASDGSSGHESEPEEAAETGGD